MSPQSSPLIGIVHEPSTTAPESTQKENIWISGLYFPPPLFSPERWPAIILLLYSFRKFEASYNLVVECLFPGGPRKVESSWSQDPVLFQAWKDGCTGYDHIRLNLTSSPPLPQHIDREKFPF